MVTSFCDGHLIICTVKLNKFRPKVRMAGFLKSNIWGLNFDIRQKYKQNIIGPGRFNYWFETDVSASDRSIPGLMK